MQTSQTKTNLFQPHSLVKRKPAVLRFFELIHEDVQSALERDPAARSPVEVLLLYSGLHAVWSHRVAHWLWKRKIKFFARAISQTTRFFTGIEIHPGATIQHNLFIDHGMGVVIGETAEIGSNVTLYHGVTLGGVSLEKGKRHPTLEDNVVVGAGAKVLGNIVIGNGSRIGANAVVNKPVPPNSVVVGVPGQVVMRSKPAQPRPDLEHNKLPDTFGDSIHSVMARLEVLEKQLNIHVITHDEPSPLIHAPEHGVWRGEDFMI